VFGITIPEAPSRSLNFVVTTVVHRGINSIGALQVVTAGRSSRCRLGICFSEKMPYSDIKMLDTEPLGLAHVYRANFSVELSKVLKEAADKNSWTTTFEPEIDGLKYEMQYTLDWTKVWKQELHLKSPPLAFNDIGCLLARLLCGLHHCALLGSIENKRLTISSFESVIGGCVPWGSHQGLYKSFIEKEALCKIEKLNVRVTVELRRMLPKQVERNYELVRTLLANVEETGDVELRGKNYVVKAHSIVLSMPSSTLKAKFERWTDGLPFIFNLDESIPEDVSRAMVHYFYTERVPEISAFENRHPLFKLADQLGQQHLMKEWGRTMPLGEEETRDIVLWPELDLPEMEALKSRVADAAKKLSMKAIERHGLDLAREVLLAVKRRHDACGVGDDGNNNSEGPGEDAVSGAKSSSTSSDSGYSSSESEDSEDAPASKRIKS
jgi:hypothetical protein